MLVSKKSFTDDIYQFFIKHWFISSLLSSIASLWFMTVEILGKNLKWVDDKDILSPFVLVLFWIFSIVSLLYSLIKANYDFKSANQNINENALFDELISCNYTLHTKNSDRLLSHLSENHFNLKKKNSLAIMFNIKSEGEELLEQINMCLSKTLKMQREKIGLSIVVKLDNEDKWNIFSKLYTSSNSSVDDLFNNKSSVAYRIIHENINFLFEPDKNKAYSDHNYVKSNKDGSNVQGSIICANISVGSNGTRYINAILSITTYEEKICDDDDKREVEEIIKYIINRGFGKYINLLLLRYYTIKQINMIKQIS